MKNNRGNWVVLLLLVLAFLALVSLSYGLDIDAIVTVPLAGDTNGDFCVDISDLIKVGYAFGSTPGQANWDPDADLKPDGKINVLDLSLVGKNYGNGSGC